MSLKPLLFISDAISQTSGLGRITRDLAARVYEHLGDVYRVGTVGYGGFGSRRFPWPDYHLHSIDNWLIPELPAIADDFAEGEELITFYIWDASRLYWLGIPTLCPQPHLRKFAERKDVKKWLYGAIDAEGPNGKLSHRIAQTYKGFDRVIDYSAFSSRVTGNPVYLPHGIDTKVFYPCDPKQARELFMQQGFQGLKLDSLLVGIVATNQARKNWQLGIETCRVLLDKGHDLRAWCHTDVAERYWSIGNLIVDYGLAGRAAVTVDRFTDERLAWMYSACDVTLGIGPEGFGYPIAESLACGVPCIAGSYGAQAEFVPDDMQIDPSAYFYEGAFCSKRPVHDAERWASLAALHAMRRKQAAANSLLPSHVDWNADELWPAWEKWFREGLA
jgi:glycosyltransferase involved in cell wall biosynthesis